jgi:hypothetical protein
VPDQELIAMHSDTTKMFSMLSAPPLAPLEMNGGFNLLFTDPNRKLRLLDLPHSVTQQKILMLFTSKQLFQLR